MAGRQTDRQASLSQTVLDVKQKKFNKNLRMRQLFSGFTLAEVLITLGILGIVGAMTIPTILQNIQNMQFKVAAKAAYSKASQAVQQIKLKDGGVWLYGGSASFISALLPYFKTVNTCKPLYGCVPYSNSSTMYKSLYGDNANTIYVVASGEFVTADGMFFGIDDWFCIISVDVNGYIKGPNIYGKDLFMFQVKNGSLLPMGAKGTKYPADTYCDKTTSNIEQGLGCMYYVMQDIEY